jgi:dipeptidase D
MLNKYAQLIINEYSVTDKDMSIKVSQGSKVSVQAMDYSSTNKVVLALTHIQDGVVKLSNDIKGLVQTSINAGVVRMEDGKVVITYLLRSSVESEKEYLIDKVTSMVELLGGEYVITGKYPAWEYRKESMLREMILSKNYTEKNRLFRLYTQVLSVVCLQISLTDLTVYHSDRILLIFIHLMKSLMYHQYNVHGSLY